MSSTFRGLNIDHFRAHHRSDQTVSSTVPTLTGSTPFGSTRGSALGSFAGPSNMESTDITGITKARDLEKNTAGPEVSVANKKDSTSGHGADERPDSQHSSTMAHERMLKPFPLFWGEPIPRIHISAFAALVLIVVNIKLTDHAQIPVLCAG